MTNLENLRSKRGIRGDKRVKSYTVSIRVQPNAFESYRADASRLAKEYDCLFWWKPYPENRYDLIFTNENVKELFLAQLARRHGLASPDFSLEEIERGQAIIDSLQDPSDPDAHG